MDHRQVEAWILEGLPLGAQEQRQLQAHLDRCAACRELVMGWQGVQGLLHACEPPDPQPGFAARWRARLQDQRRRAQQRQLSILFAFLSAGASLLLVPLLIQLLLILLASNDLMVEALKDALEWFGWLAFIMEVLLQAADSLARAVPVAWWAGLASALSALAALWLWLLQRLTLKSGRKGVVA